MSAKLLKSGSGLRMKSRRSMFQLQSAGGSSPVAFYKFRSHLGASRLLGTATFGTGPINAPSAGDWMLGQTLFYRLYTTRFPDGSSTDYLSGSVVITEGDNTTFYADWSIPPGAYSARIYMSLDGSNWYYYDSASGGNFTSFSIMTQSTSGPDVDMATKAVLTLDVLGDGDSIDTLTDQSGNGRNLLQATLANQPTLYAPAILNGKVPILFAPGQSMASTFGATLPGAMTRISVIQTTASASIAMLWGGTSTDFGRKHDLERSSRIPIMDSGGVLVGAGFLFSAATTYIIVEVFNGASSKLIINDVTIVSGNAGATSSTEFYIKPGLDLYVYSVDAFAAVLNDAQIASEVATLKTSYGL
jgi:hypothetical protein